ncbi:sterol desaturase family protein [Phenylobacterium aquaticum]|uniref:sterol desaturase family protein n=1 Tax=Phenylobacterium aquaticum TaxID=1763816 RepID=UPI0026F11C34|nr:sterol desaturase family protein [Phenylobacterium aquaticum]
MTRAANPRLGWDRVAILLGFIVYAALLAGAWWGLSPRLPDRLTVQLLGHDISVGNVRDRVLSAGMLMLAILPFALWLEWLVVGWARSSTRRMLFARTRSIKTDLALLVLAQGQVLDLLGRLMMLGASMISGGWIRDWLSANTGFTVDPTGLPIPLQVVIYFYVYTFFDYWTHRLDHSRWFWPLHRYHHSAEDFCVATSARQHPAAFTVIFMINVPLAILGAPPAVMLYVNVVATTVGFLIHSQLTSDWGWVGRWIIQSPLHHRAHHKLDMSEPTGHFAMAPVWDHLFGTWRGAADPALAIGVDTPYRHGFWVAPDLLRDYWHFLTGRHARALARQSPPAPMSLRPDPASTA